MKIWIQEVSDKHRARILNCDLQREEEIKGIDIFTYLEMERKIDTQTQKKRQTLGQNDR